MGACKPPLHGQPQNPVSQRARQHLLPPNARQSRERKKLLRRNVPQHSQNRVGRPFFLVYAGRRLYRGIRTETRPAWKSTLTFEPGSSCGWTNTRRPASSTQNLWATGTQRLRPDCTAPSPRACRWTVPGTGLRSGPSLPLAQNRFPLKIARTVRARLRIIASKEARGTSASLRISPPRAARCSALGIRATARSKAP